MTCFALHSAAGPKDGTLNELATAPIRTDEQPRSNWNGYWRKVFQFDKSRMIPLIALRNAAGVAVPIALGAAFGMPLGGLAVGTGALQVSYSDSPGPYAQRARRMVAASLMCSLAVVAGGLAVRRPIFAVILVSVWAFIAGLAVCLGPTAESLGVISLVTLIIYAVQPLTPERALVSGILALGGGLLQTMLSLLLWPIRRYQPERRTLSVLYFELARASVTPALSGGPPASEQITLARESLSGLGNDTNLEAERYWSLLNQAERIRLSLLTLRRLRRRMQRDNSDLIGFQSTEEFLTIAADVLASVAQSLSGAESANTARNRLPELVALAESLRQAEITPAPAFLAALTRDARLQMDALIGQLRSVVRTVNETSPAELEAFVRREETRPWSRRFSGNLAKLLANLTLQSSAFRHAVRLSLCLVIGGLVAHQLQNRRSYWLAMTIVLVLKPEFATTFSRGALRIGGTILGLLLATGLFHFLPAGMAWKVVLVGVFVFLLRWVGPANYGVFTIAVSALIVVLVAFTGVSPKQVILARGEMTCLGGLIALVTYLVWPTWDRTQAAQLLGRMLARYRLYFNSVTEARLSAQSQDESELGRLRMSARLERSNLEACVGRLRVEPGTTSEQIDLLTAIMANSHRFVRATMALETLPSAAGLARREFQVFASDVNKTLESLELALQGDKTALRHLPDLREDHRRLVNSSDSEVSRHALINEETDRMTNSLNTLTEQVLQWLRMN
jgi:uncharacterized membrane protein YccC